MKAKFDIPVIDTETTKLYEELYGDAGSSFIDIMNTSPDEIAVISRLIAYLKIQKEVK